MYLIVLGYPLKMYTIYSETFDFFFSVLKQTTVSQLKPKGLWRTPAPKTRSKLFPEVTLTLVMMGDQSSSPTPLTRTDMSLKVISSPHPHQSPQKSLKLLNTSELSLPPRITRGSKLTLNSTVWKFTKMFLTFIKLNMNLQSTSI